MIGHLAFMKAKVHPTVVTIIDNFTEYVGTCRRTKTYEFGVVPMYFFAEMDKVILRQEMLNLRTKIKPTKSVPKRLLPPIYEGVDLRDPIAAPVPSDDLVTARRPSIISETWVNTSKHAPVPENKPSSQKSNGAGTPSTSNETEATQSTQQSKSDMKNGRKKRKSFNLFKGNRNKRPRTPSSSIESETTQHSDQEHCRKKRKLSSPFTGNQEKVHQTPKTAPSIFTSLCLVNLDIEWSSLNFSHFFQS